MGRIIEDVAREVLLHPPLTAEVLGSVKSYKFCPLLKTSIVLPLTPFLSALTLDQCQRGQEEAG